MSELATKGHEVTMISAFHPKGDKQLYRTVLLNLPKSERMSVYIFVILDNRVLMFIFIFFDTLFFYLYRSNRSKYIFYIH
nr:unnamed protein product [Callosobruchus analis]